MTGYRHAVVLIALHGTRVVFPVEDVVSVEAQPPFAVCRCPPQTGIHAEDRVDVVHSLYGFRLEERIEHELEVLRAAKFHGCRAAKYRRELPAVERQVEEAVALVVATHPHSIYVTVKPLPCIKHR